MCDGREKATALPAHRLTAPARSGITTVAEVQQGTLALGFQGKRSRITFNSLFGTERDYLSRSLGADALQRGRHERGLGQEFGDHKREFPLGMAMRRHLRHG